MANSQVNGATQGPSGSTDVPVTVSLVSPSSQPNVSSQRDHSAVISAVDNAFARQGQAGRPAAAQTRAPVGNPQGRLSAAGNSTENMLRGVGAQFDDPQTTPPARK